MPSGRMFGDSVAGKLRKYLASQNLTERLDIPGSHGSGGGLCRTQTSLYLYNSLLATSEWLNLANSGTPVRAIQILEDALQPDDHVYSDYFLGKNVEFLLSNLSIPHQFTLTIYSQPLNDYNGASLV